MHILYIEDEYNDAVLVRRYVQTTPHQITIVETTKEAIKVLESAPSLILVDVLLGGVRDGLEFVKMARQRGYMKPMIAITGLTLPQDLEKCLAVGCTEVVSKPYSINELDRVINKYL
jgi:CheY-like chemotaxis protein